MIDTVRPVFWWWSSILGSAAWMATGMERTLSAMLKSQSLGVQSAIVPWCT